MENHSDIGDVIAKLRRRLRVDQKVREFEVFKNWEEIVGAKLARHTKPLFVAEEVLYVEAEGSAWIQEASFAKKEIIQNFNKLFGKEKVKDLKCRIRE